MPQNAVFDASQDLAAVCDEEDLPMTIQVGMLASDGIVLAGDTRRTRSPILGDQPWAGARYGENGTKMRINESRKIAVSCASGLENAEPIAQKIVEQLDTSDRDRVVAAIEDYAKAMPGLDKQKDAQCLIAIVEPELQLFRLTAGYNNGQWTARCEPMTRIGIAGDTVNAAIFWVERYYNLWRRIEEKPMAKLIPLAAQLVVSAHALSTATISGLEIVTCSSNSVKVIPQNLIDELEQRAAKREDKIWKLISNDK